MKFLLSIFFTYIILKANALVFHEKLVPGPNGCMGKTGELQVGGFEKAEDVCGIRVCQNKEGEALVHYCQIPVAFAHCEENGVNTEVDFPQCCWICVCFKNCDKPSSST